MLGNLLAIFGLIIVLVIFIEYRNEKKYQEERRKKREKRLDENSTRNNRSTRKDISREKTPRVQREKQKKEQPKKQLPHCNYPKFSHARLVDMGLSDEEAKEFISELIPQIEEQIPLIEEAMNIPDFHQMERLTHSIKGSATNIGTGGISDLLVECNTYLKTGTDSEIAKVYFDNLVHYAKELKNQYT